MTKQAQLFVFLGMIVLFAGCRGTITDKEPFHISPNMDHQEKFQAQEENAMFADNRAMRPLVPGTVARGFLRDDVRFYQGRDEAGELIAELPVPVTRELLERGQDRYEVYCTVCHGSAGDGKGVIMVGNGGEGYGYVPAPDFHTDLIREYPDGHFFEVISYGIRNMPGYAQQIPVADRWAITAYVRALQLSRTAPGTELPASQLPQGQ